MTLQDEHLRNSSTFFFKNAKIKLPDREQQMKRTTASETMSSTVINNFVIPLWDFFTDVLVAIYASTAPWYTMVLAFWTATMGLVSAIHFEAVIYKEVAEKKR